MRQAIIAAILAIVFVSGWWVNGTRWENKYTALVNQHTQAVLVAQEAAKKEQERLESIGQKERQTKDEKIARINTELADALVRLRNRPARPPELPQPACPGGGATGTQLFAEDAEFLTREAARADQIAAERDACYARYNALIRP